MNQQATYMAIWAHASQQHKTEANQSALDFKRRLQEHYLQQEMRRERDLIEGHRTKMGQRNLPQHLKARLDHLRELIV